MLYSLLAMLFMANDTVTAPRDSLAPQVADSMRVDTLKEVTVQGGRLPLEKAIDRNLQQKVPLRIPSLGEILEKVAPGINDKITHPFAIKQRKMERRTKRTRKILEHYDQVKTFDDLLREAIQREALLQEETNVKKEQQ